MSLDFTAHANATTPPYDPNAPGEYTCALTITDPNDTVNTTKTVNLKFIVKPPEVNVSNSPGITPPTQKIELNKADALTYTCADVKK